MPFVIAVLVIIALMVYLNWRKTPAAKKLDLKLAVVGFEGSGKTVYVGCMFDRLRIPGAEGIFLHAAPEHAGKLLGLYQKTADVDAPFPGGTAKGELTEWPLIVKARSAAGASEVAKISYLDFAGESLRDIYRAPNPETRQLHSRFTGADVLMAVLDGVEVKHFMEDSPGRTFFTDLGTLLALLSNHQKAANLILTKWDVLEKDYTFSQVAGRLLEIDVLADFVRSQRMVGACRLLPISSLGQGFVVQEAAGGMRKQPGKAPNPVRVDLPIACALPDAVTAAGNRAEEPRFARAVLAWARAVSIGVGPFSLGLERDGIQYAQYAMNATSRTPASTAQLIRYCQDRVTRLEAEFPESDLVRLQLRRGE